MRDRIRKLCIYGSQTNSVGNLILLLCAFALICNGANQSFAQSKSEEKFPPTERTEFGTKWKVKGKVTSVSMRPLSGVKVYLTSSVIYQPMNSNRDDRLSQPVTTDFAGNFEINVQEQHLLIFETRGFAPLAVPVPEGSALEVQMETGRTISGKVLDPSGAPIANSIVKPVRWLVPRPKPRYKSTKGDGGFAANFYAGLPGHGEHKAVKTDAQGNFKIPNMPSDIRIGLSVKTKGWKEELIFVRPKDDVDPPDDEDQKLFENEFEYHVEPCSLLKIKAFEESGNPAPIARISVHEVSKSSNIFDFRRTESFNSPEATLSQNPQPTGTIAYIEPVNSERLLGVRLTLPPNDDIETVEKEVTFQKGYPIRGKVVSESTGKPIAGVKIKWVPRNSPKDKSIERPIPVLESETNRFGEFSFAVPDVDAVIGISGKVDGFCSMPDIHTHRKAFEGFADEVFDRLTIDLEKNALTDFAPVEFKLRPSLGVDIEVVDEEGQPAPNTVLTWSKKTNVTIDLENGSYGGAGYSPESFTAETDAQGRATIVNLYDNEFYLALGKVVIDESDKSRAFENHALRSIIRLVAYPLAIQAFSIDGFKQGQAEVPLEKPADTESLFLTMKLLPGADVLGQIIDTESKGIVDLTVTAKSSGQSGQQWTTKTRSDGWFKMQGLPPGVNLSWSLDNTRVKTRRLTIRGSNLVQGKVFKTEPIVCADYSMLVEDLPTIEIDGLENEEALKALVGFIKECHSRIPSYDIRFSQGGLRDPVPQFKDRVTDKAIAIMTELADRDPGSEFELKLLVGAGELFLYDPRNERNLGLRAFNYRRQFNERLIANHSDKVEAQELLIDIAKGLGSFNGDKHWRKLFEASPVKETKAIAAGAMAKVTQQLMQAFGENVDQPKFDKLFAELVANATEAESRIDDLPPNWQKIFSKQLKYSISSLEILQDKDIPNRSGRFNNVTMKESRLKKVTERLRKLKEIMDGSNEEN